MDPRTPAAGQFVSVNGHRLYLRYMGNTHSGPVVILEAALASTSSQWDWVQPTLASAMPVVAYDRAGLGRPFVGIPNHGWNSPAGCRYATGRCTINFKARK